MYSNDYEFTVLYHQQAVQFSRNERMYRILEELIRIRRQERRNRVTALVRRVFRPVESVAAEAGARLVRTPRHLEPGTGPVVRSGGYRNRMYEAGGGR